MWTPEGRALVGNYGSGQALTDDQWRMLQPPHRRARYARLPMAAFATISGVPAVADCIWLLPRLP